MGSARWLTVRYTKNPTSCEKAARQDSKFLQGKCLLLLGTAETSCVDRAIMETE